MVYMIFATFLLRVSNDSLTLVKRGQLMKWQVLVWELLHADDLIMSMTIKYLHSAKSRRTNLRRWCVGDKK